MAEEASHSTRQLFAQFVATRPAPREPDEIFASEMEIPTLEEAEDTEDREEALGCWLPEEGRFVPWPEWRAKTWGQDPVQPPIVEDPLPRKADRIRARMRDATIELRHNGDRWDRWVLTGADRYQRVKETATPFFDHARRWAEEVYGPPLEPWTAVHIHQARPHKAKSEEPG